MPEELRDGRRKGWWWASNAIWDMPHLGRNEILVYMFLCCSVSQHGRCAISRKAISTACRMSLDTLDRALAGLEKAGLVRKEARFDPEGRQIANVYTVLDPDPPPQGGGPQISPGGAANFTRGSRKNRTAGAQNATPKTESIFEADIASNGVCRGDVSGDVVQHPKQHPPEEAVTQVQTLAAEVLGHELPPRAARELARYPAAYVRHKMELARTVPGVRNIVGWLIRACREDWRPPPGTKKPGPPRHDGPDLQKWQTDKYQDLYLS